MREVHAAPSWLGSYLLSGVKAQRSSHQNTPKREKTSESQSKHERRGVL